MGWIAWVLASITLLMAGAYLFRRGWTKIVGIYVIACVVLVLVYAVNIGAIFGPSFESAPKWLLLAILPGTVILAALAVKRDRDKVMGRTGDREAVATAAVLYGAGSTHLEGGAGDAGGGFES